MNLYLHTSEYTFGMFELISVSQLFLFIELDVLLSIRKTTKDDQIHF